MLPGLPVVPSPWLALGDLHGRPWRLEQAASRFPSHRLVLLGDLIDRGESVAGLLSLCRSLAAERELTLLLGNHEAMAIAALLQGDAAASVAWQDGVMATWYSYAARGGRPAFLDDLRWLAGRMVPAASLLTPAGPLLAVHACPPPRSGWEGLQPGAPLRWDAAFLWDRPDLGEALLPGYLTALGAAGLVLGHHHLPQARLEECGGAQVWWLAGEREPASALVCSPGEAPRLVALG